METNNKLREALVKTLDAIKSFSRTHNDDLPEDVCAILGRMAFEVNEALSEPARQCDVGSAEEQYKRYSAFTSRWTPCSFNGHARCAGDCPVNKKLERDGSGDLQCPFVWAQTPYAAEEGAGK